MSAQVERLNKIVQQVADLGAVSVGSLARELDVSEATVRRDLDLLDEQRLLVRTHGGAAQRSGVTYELPLRYRAEQHRAEKARIAEAAAKLVVGDLVSVGLTGGTTTTEVARRLAQRPLTIVTNALNIAAELAVRPNLKLVVTGGVARPESYELVGPLAEATLEGLNLDVVFLGVDGVTTTSVTTHHEVEAQTDRRLIERAQRVIVVCDASKIGRAAFAEICPLKQVDEIVTSADISPLTASELREAGVKLTAV
jgi:DeoR family transcriptional regulator of aga operon